MFRKLFSLMGLVVLGVVVYNYFLGSPGQKNSAKGIVDQTLALVENVFGFLKDQSSKIRSGEYDEKLTNFREKAGSLIKKAQNTDVKGKIEDWQAKHEKFLEEKENIEKLLSNLGESKADKQRASELLKGLDGQKDLLERAMKNLESQIQP